MKKKISKEKLFYYSITLLIAILIFLFSTLSTTSGGLTGLNLATLYHLSIFFAFTFFLSLAVKRNNLNTKTILFILIISLVYALSDEFHQLFVPGRFASLKDVLVDMIGSSLALLTLKVLERFKKI